MNPLLLNFQFSTVLLSSNKLHVFKSNFSPFRVMLSLINLPAGFSRGLNGIIAKYFGKLKRPFQLRRTQMRRIQQFSQNLDFLNSCLKTHLFCSEDFAVIHSLYLLMHNTNSWEFKCHDFKKNIVSEICNKGPVNPSNEFLLPNKQTNSLIWMYRQVVFHRQLELNRSYRVAWFCLPLEIAFFVDH